MIRMESVARQLWCPFARTFNGRDAAAAVNRRYGSGKAESDCLCLGSGCMAWRWQAGSLATHYSKGEAQPWQDDGPKWTQLPDDDDDAPGWIRPNPHRAGFCGLAGRPEVPA